MKKSLLIALVGFLFFAMTSCGDSTKANKESKEFAAAKAYIEKYDKAFQNEEDAEGLDSSNFAEEDRITDDEEDALKDLVMGWLETIQKKVNELGCDEEEVEEDVIVVDEE